MIVVDGANVVGSRPDGWWRDRAGAAGRLHRAIDTAIGSGRLDGPVVLVLEGEASAGVPASTDGPLTVVHAPASGDDAVVAVVSASATPSATPSATTVVTADRELVARCHALGATTVGPRWLLDRL